MDQRLRATIATASSMADRWCVKAPRHLVPGTGDMGTGQGPEDFRDLHGPEASSHHCHRWPSSVADRGAALKPPDIWCPHRDKGTARDLRIFGTCTGTRGFEPPSPRMARLRGRKLALSSPQGQGHRTVRPPGVLQIRGKVSVRPPLERFSSHFSPLHPLP